MIILDGSAGRRYWYVALTDNSRLSLPVVSFARRRSADESFSASRTKDEMFGAIV
jgi:hypothetical protein